MFFLYILYSEKLDRYYVGSTEDISKRLERHNSAKVSATKYGLPWVVKYSENFASRTQAVNRELYIKRMKSRKYIESLVRGAEGSKHKTT